MRPIMTEQGWLELDREYRAVFGEGIPHMTLPADEEAKAALVRKAIDSRDEGALDQGIPVTAAI